MSGSIVSNFQHLLYKSNYNVQSEPAVTFERDVAEGYTKTTGYSIFNTGIPVPRLIVDLVIPNSENTLFDRARRTYNEPLYVVFSDWFDKLVTLSALLSLIVLVILYAYMANINAERSIVLKNGQEMTPEKQKKLDLLNNVISPIAQVLSIIPIIVAGWNWFKRTTKPINKMRRKQTVAPAFDTQTNIKTHRIRNPTFVHNPSYTPNY